MIERFAFLMILVLTLSFAAAGQTSAGSAGRQPASALRWFWLQKGQKNEKKGPGPDIAKAQVVFKENCAVCHWPDKTEKRIGPGLKGLFQREKLSDGRPVNEENVRNIILKGGEKMVGFEEKLDSKQVDALLAYLKTL